MSFRSLGDVISWSRPANIDARVAKKYHGYLGVFPIARCFLLAQCIAGVPLAVCAYFKFGGYWAIVGWVVGAMITGLPIDKMILDEKYRPLQKLEDDKRA